MKPRFSALYRETVVILAIAAGPLPAMASTHLVLIRRGEAKSRPQRCPTVQEMTTIPRISVDGDLLKASTHVPNNLDHLTLREH